MPEPDVIETAQRVAGRVSALPDVVELSAGAYGTIATLGAGLRVKGVAVRTTGIEVGVVVRYGRPLPEVAGDVRRTAAEAAGPDAGAVHVSVEDVVAGVADGA
ncbi:Asp23/Gls24 family envelope stress response protein [Nocardiopsis coralliicola]